MDGAASVFIMDCKLQKQSVPIISWVTGLVSQSLSLTQNHQGQNEKVAGSLSTKEDINICMLLKDAVRKLKTSNSVLLVVRT